MTRLDRNRKKKHLLWEPPVIGRLGRKMHKPTFLAMRNMPSRARRGRKTFKQTQSLVKRGKRGSSRLRAVKYLR